MWKHWRCAESSVLRKRWGTERSGSRTTNTRNWWQRSWTPILDSVVVDAQGTNHWFEREWLESKLLQLGPLIIISSEARYRKDKRSWDLPRMMSCGWTPCVKASDSPRAIRSCHASLTEASPISWCTNTVAFPRGGNATGQHSISSGNRNAFAGWRCGILPIP